MYNRFMIAGVIDANTLVTNIESKYIRISFIVNTTNSNGNKLNKVKLTLNGKLANTFTKDIDTLCKKIILFKGYTYSYNNEENILLVEAYEVLTDYE